MWGKLFIVIIWNPRVFVIAEFVYQTCQSWYFITLNVHFVSLDTFSWDDIISRVGVNITFTIYSDVLLKWIAYDITLGALSFSLILRYFIMNHHVKFISDLLLAVSSMCICLMFDVISVVRSAFIDILYLVLF